MTNVDDTIRKALRAEDDDLLKDLAEPGIMDRMTTAMRKGPRWTTAFVLLIGLVLHAVLIWFAVMFFTATETRAMIGWATGFLFVTIFIVAMKIWFWMQMEKYVVLRELKRLEAQVAQLAERLSR